MIPSDSGRQPHASSGAFVGVLESPLGHGRPLLGEQVELRGWALSEDAVDCVVATLDDDPAVLLNHGIERADVATAFEGHRHAAASGFTGWLDVANHAPGPHELRVEVRSVHGTLHEWRRPVEVADVDESYRRWRERLQSQRAPDAPTTGPLATWLIRAGTSEAEDQAKADAQRLRVEGGGRWEAMIVAMGAAEALPPLSVLGVTTPLVGVLDVGDRLAPDAADWLATGWAEGPDVDLVYFDHDHFDASGHHMDPVLKPGWSPLLARHPDVASRGWLARTSKVPAVPWHPEQVAARCASAWHIARPLLTLASRPPDPPVAEVSAATMDMISSLSVVIPTRLADLDQFARCLDGLRRVPHGDGMQIVAVLNNLGATSPVEARAFLRRWQVDTVEFEGVFNWSRLNNLGAARSRGDRLLFLNDDVEPLRPDWLAALLALAEEPGIGAVGALLRYPDGRLQHGGIVLHGGRYPECRHSFRHCSGLERRAQRWLGRDRVQTAVTGACLLTTRAAFDALDGFDESLAVVFNDVDFCLRLRDRGLLCAVAAAAELRHHEGMSRAGIAEAADRRHFESRWAAALPLTDPYSHPSLIRDRDDWMFDPARLPAIDPLCR